MFISSLKLKQESSLFKKAIIYYMCFPVCLCTHIHIVGAGSLLTCHCPHMVEVRGQLTGARSSLSLCGALGIEALAIRFSGKCLYQLSHLPDSHITSYLDSIFWGKKVKSTRITLSKCH